MCLEVSSFNTSFCPQYSYLSQPCVAAAEGCSKYQKTTSKEHWRRAYVDLIIFSPQTNHVVIRSLYYRTNAGVLKKVILFSSPSGWKNALLQTNSQLFLKNALLQSSKHSRMYFFPSSWLARQRNHLIIYTLSKQIFTSILTKIYRHRFNHASFTSYHACQCSKEPFGNKQLSSLPRLQWKRAH